MCDTAQQQTRTNTLVLCEALSGNCCYLCLYPLSLHIELIKLVNKCSRHDQVWDQNKQPLKGLLMILRKVFRCTLYICDVRQHNSNTSKYL